MGVQDHKIAATSAGHEGHHGVHLCHRCGWPFPKAHPSSKHRRAHKRLCGTIEGYKIIHSDHLVVSDDEGASDGDELHTPSPNTVKKFAESSGGVGGRSAKSEDDVFSDAVTDFSDSGLSPQSSVGFESVSELVKSSEKKSVGGDLYGSGALEVEEAAVNADRPEQYNDARSEALGKPGYLANGNDHTDNVIPITAPEMVSVGNINDSKPEHGFGGNDQGEMDTGHDADIQVPASLSLDSGEVKVLDQTIAAEGSQDELCDKFASEGPAKDDSPAPSESLQMNASEEDGVVYSVEASPSINDSKPEHGFGGNDQGEMDTGHDADIQVPASLSLDSGEVKVLDQTIAAEGSQDELCDKFASEGPAKEDSPAPSESLQMNASEEDGVVYSAEASPSIKHVEVALPDETNEFIDASVGNKEVSLSPENVEVALPDETNELIDASVGNEGTEALDVTEHSEVACSVSSIDKEELPKASLNSVDASEGEKSDKSGSNDSESLEFKNLSSVVANSALGFTHNALPREDNNALMAKKDVDHCGEQTISITLETENDKGEEASAGLEVIPDSTIPSEKRTESQSSLAADSDEKSLQELSEKNSSEKDDNLEKFIQGDGADKVTEVPQSVGSETDEIGDTLGKSSFPTSSLEPTVSPVTPELQNNMQMATNVSEVESLDIAETLSKLEDDDAVLVSMPPLSDPVSLGESAAHDGSSLKEDYKASKSKTTIDVAAEDHENNVASREISETFTPTVQEVFPPDVKQTHSSDDPSMSKSVDLICSAEHTFDGKVSKSDECAEPFDAPSLKQPVPSPSDVEDFHGTSVTADDKAVINVENITRVDAESVKTEDDYKPSNQTEDASGTDMSSNLISRSDSLEANCGSVVSDTIETNSQKNKTPSEEAHPDKSDTFEPPSFMTLVQSGSEGDHKVTADAEIETVQNNQQPKSDALQAGWFPSLTNVVNESEGRKKNEEIIAKVTNWTPVKQQHGPLKSLLNEVKSPNTQQLPAANQKVEAEAKHDNMGSGVASETHTNKDQGTTKHVEEWNSPARYPIEIKKEKKKGRPFWVPFVCCSSAHRDL